MCFFFGDSAYQIAGTEGDSTERKKWLRKAVRRLMKEVDRLDTTPRHAAMLLKELEVIDESISCAEAPTRDLVYGLFRLSFRLLGFDYRPGRKCHTIIYFQTPDQHYASQARAGGDVLDSLKDRRDAVSLRREVVESLKTKGLEDFKIALVLNTSEYKVKQLRRNPRIAEQNEI